MSTNFFQKYNRFIFPGLILFLSILVTFIWFRKGLMFAGGEEGLPFYNLSNNLNSIFYVWMNANGGYPLVLLLPRIPFFAVLSFLFQNGFSAVALQFLTFFILIFTGCISVYFLILETINKKLEAFISAIFYLLNPFSMVQIWGRGIYAQFFAFALIPSFLLFFILGIKKKRLIYILLCVVISILFSPAFVFPTQVLVLWLPVLTFAAFSVWRNRTNKNEILFIISTLFLLILFWLLSQSWWIWPYFKTLNENITRLGDLNSNIASLVAISGGSTMSVTLRLIHTFLLNGQYGNIYSNPIFLFISWLVLLLSLYSFKNIFKNYSFAGFFVALFLISLFLVNGTNFPLGWLFVWFFKNIPVFQGFRNPYEKVGILLMLSFTPFVSIGITKVSDFIDKYFKNKTKRLSVWVILFLICGVYVWPMWTGQFSGGVKTNPWTRVPSYYKEADDWIVNNSHGERLIQMPINPGDGVLAKWNNSFQGIDPNEYIFTNPTIARNIQVNKIYYNVLLDRFGVLQKNAFGPDPDISMSEFRSKDLYSELSKLNIKFIVLHKDVDEKLSSMKTSLETEKYLESQKNIKKVKTFGALDIYQIDLPKEIDYLYSPDIKINYEQVNPTLYKFNIQSSKGKIKLNFLESYSPNWELFIDGNKIETHTTVFSYANSWNIDRTGSYSGYIRYKTQDYVEEGKKVSINTVIIIIVTILVLTIRDKIKQNDKKHK